MNLRKSFARKKEVSFSKLKEHTSAKMLNKYKFNRLLGEGSFARVYLYQHIKTKKKYAVKKLDMKKL